MVVAVAMLIRVIKNTNCVNSIVAPAIIYLNACFSLNFFVNGFNIIRNFFMLPACYIAGANEIFKKMF